MTRSGITTMLTAIERLFTIPARAVSPLRSMVKEGAADEIGENTTIASPFLISWENGR